MPLNYKPSVPLLPESGGSPEEQGDEQESAISPALLMALT